MARATAPILDSAIQDMFVIRKDGPELMSSKLNTDELISAL